MARLAIDEAPLPVASSAAARLSEKVFRVYRDLAAAQKAIAQGDEVRRQEVVAAVADERSRTAEVAAEAFHLRRTAASVRAALEAAGCAAELGRLELMVQRLDRLLAKRSIEVLALDGLDLEGELPEQIEVLTFVPADVPVTRIRETVEPMVKIDGEVVRIAKVITEVPRQS